MDTIRSQFQLGSLQETIYYEPRSLLFMSQAQLEAHSMLYRLRSLLYYCNCIAPSSLPFPQIAPEAKDTVLTGSKQTNSKSGSMHRRIVTSPRLRRRCLEPTSSLQPYATGASSIRRVSCASFLGHRLYVSLASARSPADNISERGAGRPP